jgi:glycosyltransferase involved in cell wall biosynthesis
VWAQEFCDYEVLALDDGSTDGTREYLLGLGERVRTVLNERNLGTYATLNVGLERASGEFIAVLNDDDVWLPGKLARQIELMDSHPDVGLCHTDGWFIDGEGRRLEGSPLGFEFPRTPTGRILPALLYANKIIASAALVRRQCFENLGGFDVAYFGSGDWDMWLRVAERYDIGFVPEPLTLYRVHGENASHKLERIWKDDQLLREKIVGRMLQYSSLGYSPEEMRRAFAHNWACLGTVRKLNGQGGGARRAYWQSIRLQPGRAKSWLRLAASCLPRDLFRRLN